MPIYKKEYNGHIIEINECPVYHDFVYSVKTLEGKTIIKSYRKHDNYLDAEFDAQLQLNLSEDI